MSRNKYAPTPPPHGSEHRAQPVPHLMARWRKCREKGRRLSYREEQLLLRAIPNMERPADLYRNSQAAVLFDGRGVPRDLTPEDRAEMRRKLAEQERARRHPPANLVPEKPCP